MTLSADRWFINESIASGLVCASSKLCNSGGFVGCEAVCQQNLNPTSVINRIREVSVLQARDGHGIVLIA